MRSLHAKIKSEYGKEGVNNLRQWEKLEMKMADFKNHRFTLRFLSQGLVPVSIKLKSTVKTPKGTYIVRKAEKMLMNERVRVINNSITMFNCQIDTCINNLERLLEKVVLEECRRFIVKRREKRHIQTQKRQRNLTDCGRETQVAAQTQILAEEGKEAQKTHQNKTKKRNKNQILKTTISSHSNNNKIRNGYTTCQIPH